jgi:hypothetical protein
VRNTGLSLGSIDKFENEGCRYNDDNFLKYLSIEIGEEYFLFLNNYSSTAGLTFSIDGSVELSLYDDCKNTRELSLLELLVYPNPAYNNINIEFTSDHDQKDGLLEILDYEGRTILRRSVDIVKGKNHFNEELGVYISGNYIVRISDEQFSSLSQFIKQ